MQTLTRVPISLFAIDEAHCISEWGHDFRPDYLNLSLIPELFPNVPIAAFTATATEKVQQDIITRVGLRKPYCIRASFDRPNLFYDVERKNSVRQQLLDFLKTQKDVPGIIYRTTREGVEETAQLLQDNGFRAIAYHAGLEPQLRQQRQDAFSRDEVEIVVATIAFGMGIDKSNVRFVVHLDLPKNLESYYQETGRAGRDGELAHCKLFFGRGDIPKIRYFIEQIANPDEKKVAESKLQSMIRYASHTACRRQQLLGYFGENHPGDCGHCDVCVSGAKKEDLTRETQIFLSAMVRTHQRFGIKHIIDIVMGAQNKRILSLRHNHIKTFGVGKDLPRTFWQQLVDELLLQNIIRRESSDYPILKLQPLGMQVLYENHPVEARIKKQVPKKSAAFAPSVSTTIANQELFQELRELRKQIAREEQVPPFVVFSDKSLLDMCRIVPQSLADFAKVNGVGKVKLEKYGDTFLAAISDYLSSKNNFSKS